MYAATGRASKMADSTKMSALARGVYFWIVMFNEPMEPILHPENKALIAALWPVTVTDADKSCGSFSSAKKESRSSKSGLPAISEVTSSESSPVDVIMFAEDGVLGVCDFELVLIDCAGS